MNFNEKYKAYYINDIILNLIKKEVLNIFNWKFHKIKHGFSFKKPLYLNDLFGN